MTNWTFGVTFPNIIVVGGFTFDLTGAERSRRISCLLLRLGVLH